MTTSILLVIMLQPVHAQEHSMTNQRNVTLLIGFDSPSLQRCCDSIALSHDGSMIAYSISSFDLKSSSWQSSLSLYYLKNQTSRSLDLNNNLSTINDLSFSPDDKKLLFVGSSCDKRQSSTTYYVFNPSDINLHCNTMSNIRGADWMPDGSIVILKNNEKNDTVSIYQNGTEKLLYEKQIGPPYVSINSSHITSISASPDGKKIALWYIVMYDHKTQILDVNTGKIITTIDGGHPKWSSDSNTLSYTLPTNTGILSNRARAVDTSINLLDVNNNKTTVLYNIPVGVDFASITSNGTKVLYATNPSEPYQFLGVKAGIYAINLINGSNMVFPSIQQPVMTTGSPLKQFKSGTAPKDVQCWQGLQLILKVEDGTPACVKPSSISHLVKIGWGMLTTIAQSSNAMNSTYALKLYLSTDSTIIRSGQPIGIRISVNNTLSNPINVTAQDHWYYENVSTGPCSRIGYGIALLGGYYTIENMTEGKNLSLYGGVILCPPITQTAKVYEFQPQSDLVKEVECKQIEGFPCTTQTYEMGNNYRFTGYWEYGNIKSFNSGIYTIVGADEWGHIAIQHFLVTNSTKS